MVAQPPIPPEPRVRVRRPKKRQPQPSNKPKLVTLPQNTYPDLNISLQHERLVGRFVMTWAKIEGLIHQLIWQLLHLDFEDGKVVTARNDVEANMTALRNIAARKLPATTTEALLPLLDQVRDLQQTRNTIVHSQWITLQPMSVPTAMSIRKKALSLDSVMSEIFPTSAMYELIDKTQKCAFALDVLLSALEALPDRQPPPPHLD
jgi:hypothetical protein